MKLFAELVLRLEESPGAAAKEEALGDYFRRAPPADAAWAVALLRGERPRRLATARRLLAWAGEEAGLPRWLVAECSRAVGDLAETAALLAPPPERARDRPLSYWLGERLPALAGLAGADLGRQVAAAWRELEAPPRLVFNKLLSGGLRPAVRRRQLVRALARLSGADAATLAQRLEVPRPPTPASFAALLAPATAADPGRPYPFAAVAPLSDDPASLGPRAEWLAEWRWGGARLQLVHRGGRVWLWTQRAELVTAALPEIAAAGRLLPDGTVIEGEAVAWPAGRTLPAAGIRPRRGGRRGELPARLWTLDLLALAGSDLRPRPLAGRRQELADLLAGGAAVHLTLSTPLEASSWEALAALRSGARRRGAQGLLLRPRRSPYPAAPSDGGWLEWPAPPYTVDAVLLYARRGRGAEAGLYADYTFAVWDGERLVPLASCGAAGLGEDEVRRIDRFVRRNTAERFGPAREVAPELVFELAFDGLERSRRRKSGLALRNPRVTRRRDGLAPAAAARLAAVEALLAEVEGAAGTADC